MSSIFGQMRQIGYVEKDIQTSMRHWIEDCGVGPWYFAETMAFSSFKYMGRESNVKMAVAMANSGEFQIELIQPLNDAQSLYRDFLIAGRTGYQHLSSWPEDYDGRLREALGQGWTIAQEGMSQRGPFVYMVNSRVPENVIEMSAATPQRLRNFDAIRKAAIGWDGFDPIRPMSSLV
jgi:hypothetical protein